MYRIKTIRVQLRNSKSVYNSHNLIEISCFNDLRFCGEPRCSGDCDYPSLAFWYSGSRTEKETTFFAMSNVVASGPVWQGKSWKGKKVYINDKNIKIEEINNKTLDMWYW